MHRRTFLHAAATATATAAVASPLALTTVRAEVATPASDTDLNLAERVGAIDPEMMLEALLSTPVISPLVPRDIRDVEPVPWEDEGDSDLWGAVGGVLFRTGTDANDNPLVMATVIVDPDAASSEARLAESGPSTFENLYGLPFFARNFGDYAVAVARVGYILLAGGAEDPEADAMAAGVGDPSVGATPIAAGSSGRYHLRAVSNLAAVLDHLEDVLATLEP